MNEDSSTPQVMSSSTIASTKWLALQTLTYRDPKGKTREWDVASRTTKKSTDSTDAVIIVPLLHKEDGSTDTILVEQWRPPVRCSTLEFPAGLVDPSESIEEAALRELREETGYVGDVSTCKHLRFANDGSITVPANSVSNTPAISRQVCMSPGLCDELVQVVIVDVDCTRPENIHPVQNLDEGEYVNFRRMPLTAGLRDMMEQPGTNMPIMGLYLFALGLEIGSKLCR